MNDFTREVEFSEDADTVGSNEIEMKEAPVISKGKGSFILNSGSC